MAGRILVGTSSWADPGFIEEWYPPGMPARERLPWYSERFEAVELNSSFYAIPEVNTVARWARATPPGFTFDVKLHRLLSRHAARLDSLPPELRDDARTNERGRVLLTPELESAMLEQTLEAVAPLEEAGRLGAFLLQLTPAFAPDRNELDELRGTEDPLAAVAERTAERYRLICFDEFHVSDIADAMILGRYLEQVMSRGVEFVMTSNYPPDGLYPNGLQRERFLPAIEFLKERLDVVSVDNGTDYRRLKMERMKVYHVGTDAPLARIFDELRDVEEERQPLDVEGRRIAYRKRAGGLVWFDFDVLCGGPRSYADYVDLAKRFHTVMLSGVPHMSPKDSDAARRFTWLVDVFYDERVKLVGSAEATPEELFSEGENSAELQRTVSRLHEMQSREQDHPPDRGGFD